MSTKLRSGSACPSCNTGRLVPIVYGLPGLDLRHDAEAGAVALGASEPTEQVIVVDVGHVADEAAPMTVVFAGRAIVTVTPVAPTGPSFVTVAV